MAIITLNVNGLNPLIKRYRAADWFKKIRPIYVAYKRLTSELKTHTDWKGGDGKTFHANRHNKKARIVILISDKIEFLKIL